MKKNYSDSLYIYLFEQLIVIKIYNGMRYLKYDF